MKSRKTGVWQDWFHRISGIAVMPEIPVLSQLSVDIVPLRNQHEKRYVYMARSRDTFQPPLVHRFAEYVRNRGM